MDELELPWDGCGLEVEPMEGQRGRQRRGAAADGASGHGTCHETLAGRGCSSVGPPVAPRRHGRSERSPASDEAEQRRCEAGQGGRRERRCVRERREKERDNQQDHSTFSVLPSLLHFCSLLSSNRLKSVCSLSLSPSLSLSLTLTHQGSRFRIQRHVRRNWD